MPVSHIIRPAAPCLTTFEFGTYNEAIAYANKCAALAPSKPYKRLQGAAMPVWCVTIVNRHAIKAGPSILRVEYEGDAPSYTGLQLAGMRKCPPVNLQIEV